MCFFIDVTVITEISLPWLVFKGAVQLNLLIFPLTLKGNILSKVFVYSYKCLPYSTWTMEGKYVKACVFS